MDSADGVRRRGRIVVDGPLAPFAEGMRGELARQGYAADTIGDHVHLLADLSGWLSGRGLTPAELTSEAAREFVQARRAAGHRSGVSDRAIAPILGYLRGSRAVPPSTVVVPVTPLEVLLAQYRRYLEDERGLATGTVVHYLRYARLFLTWLPGSVEQSLPQLSAGQVIDFVRGWTERRRGMALDMVILPALRSLLRSCTWPGMLRWRWPAQSRPDAAGLATWIGRVWPPATRCGRCWAAAIAAARSAAATTRSC
jgi:Phage integrase, N-terminal SAM-like domain